MSIEKQIIEAAIRSSTSAWFETYGKIYPKDRSRGPITPRRNYLQIKYQRVLDKFDELGKPKRLIGLKPRQRGSTTFATAIDYTELRRKAASAIIIGGQYSQVTEAWGMLQTYSKNDHFDWGNTGEINTKEGRWSHGSKLISETAKDAVAGIGGTHQILHAFEVARWSRHGVSNAGEVLTNILKCVPLLPDTTIVLESTAEGAAGAFYERWLGAIDAEDFLSGAKEVSDGGYVRVFAPWFEFDDSALRLTEEQKRQIQRTLDDSEEYEGEQDLITLYGVTGEDGVMRLGNSVTDFDVWEQLAWRRYAIKEECDRDKEKFNRDYPHSWQTAFQKSGNLRFNQTGLSILRKRLAMRVPKHGLLEETKDKRVVFRQTDHVGAKFTIFEMPIRNQRYLLSVDPMTGASQTSGDDPDMHGVFVLRQGYWDGAGAWVRAATVARVVPCRWDISVLEDAVWRLARFYGNRSGCKIVIEMNMDRGLTELLRQRNADLYRREIFNKLEQKTSKAFGFLTNDKTRENLIEKLSSAIRDWDTPGAGIDIFCEHAVTQCENFVVKPNGRSEAAEGFKDDDVLSIGLGLEVLDHATMYVPPQPLPGWGEPPLRGSSQSDPSQSVAFT